MREFLPNTAVHVKSRDVCSGQMNYILIPACPTAVPLPPPDASLACIEAVLPHGSGRAPGKNPSQPRTSPHVRFIFLVVPFPCHSLSLSWPFISVPLWLAMLLSDPLTCFSLPIILIPSSQNMDPRTEILIFSLAKWKHHRSRRVQGCSSSLPPLRCS